MKRSFYSFISFVLTVIFLTVPVQAMETPEALEAPKAPSWINPKEYVINKNDQIYQKKYDWPYILEQREYAEKGGTEVSARLKSLLKNGDYVGWERSSLFFELGLVGEKMWQNSDWGFAPGEFMLESFDYARGIGEEPLLFKKVYGYDPSTYMARVWYLRAKYASYDMPTHLTNYTPINRPDLTEDPKILGVIDDLQAWYELLPYPEFNREQIMNYPSIQAYKYVPRYYDMFTRIHILIDNRALLTQNAPETINGTTMLPIAPVAESLGAVVTWDGNAKTVIIQRAKDTIKLTIGSKTAYKNDKLISLGVAPYIKNGNTYLPVRFVAEQFGQVVEWSPQKIIKISENQNILKNTNLDEWATAMSSIHAATWPNGNEYHFGFVDRNARNVKQICNNTLASGWDIESREDLLYQIYALLLEGHNGLFLEDSDTVKSYSTQERNEILKEGGEDAELIIRNEAISKKWGERGIRAFDLFRVSGLAQWGYTAGYLTLEEALALVEPAVYDLERNFSSWDEAAQNYLEGYSYWAFRSSVRDEYNARLKIYNNMKERSVEGIPPVYDDTLWKTPVKPVNGVSYKDLLKELY